MGYRKKKYQPKPFESDGNHSDTSANIYESMMKSDAWLDLTATQKVLYMTCKSQYYAEKNHPENDPTQFTMPQKKWADTYKLYRKDNAKGFIRDISALIEHGFITCVNKGAMTYTKNVYQYSSMWRKYGTTEFSVTDNNRTIAMLGTRKGKSEKEK